MKSNNGITMVSLVVTIIILIILAGITIHAFLGNNGIITKAKQAKQNIILAGEAEAMQLNQLYYELETGGELTQDEEGNKKDEIIVLLQKQVEELQKQVVALQTENEELKKQIQQLTEQIAQLQQEIENLKQQIINKDIEIAELKKQLSEKESKIQELQNQLNNLNSLLSQTNATADKILAGYKAYSGGKLLTGTMENRGAIASNLNAGQSYIVPQGYHNGAGKVIANNLTSQTIGTATTEDITQGKTAWVNGQKIVGTKQQEDVSAIYVKEMNMGSGGARTCHILYDISSTNVSTISFQIRRGTGSRAPSIYFSEDGVTFTKIAQMTPGAAYEYVEQSFSIPNNYNFVKLEWEIEDNRAWFANIKFK